MQSLKVRTLTTAETEQVFQEHLVFDFPLAEQKPLEHLLALQKEGAYPCYGLFEKDTLRGYAFFCGRKDMDCLLLDYFAITRGKRSSGYGGKFLKLLARELQQSQSVILEVEDDRFALDAEDKKIRLRRFAFYFAQGVKMTSLRTSVKGVNYKIMILPCGEIPEDEVLFENLQLLYDTLYHGEKYQKDIDEITFE